MDENDDTSNDTDRGSGPPTDGPCRAAWKPVEQSGPGRVGGQRARAIEPSQEARQRRERDKFLDIVCTDNPYAAVWQPEEGTCEQFAATIGN